VLRERQPHFSVIKACYPHFLHGRDRGGGVVCYENPGRMEFGRLAAAGVAPTALQRHYCFVNDYIWQRLSPGDVSLLGELLSRFQTSTLDHTLLCQHCACVAAQKLTQSRSGRGHQHSWRQQKSQRRQPRVV
jgi:hypothetical protein